jgi:hypothetical protein
MKRLLIIYILLILLITITSATIIIDKNKKISNLKEENKELKNMNIEYKWQLEQVPLIVESNLDNLCKEYYEKNK